MRTAITLAAAGAAGVLALSAPAVAAATTYTIKAGSQSSGAVPYTAKSGPITFTTSRGLKLGCDSGTAAGKLKLSTTSTGKAISSIKPATFTNCIGPANLKLNVAQSNAWVLNITGAPVNGVTPGNITKVAAHVSDANGQCAFDVTGSVEGNFNQNNQTLNVTKPTKGAVLTLTNVSGCFTAIQNGDTATFEASYAVTNKVGPFTIAKN